MRLLWLIGFCIFLVGCSSDVIKDPMPVERPAICTTEYDPICGVDNKTYPNECTAESQGIEFGYAGECILNVADLEIIVTENQEIFDFTALDFFINEEYSVSFENQRAENTRLAIRQSNVVVELAPDQKETVFITPEFAGIYQIELDGAPFATFKVQE